MDVTMYLHDQAGNIIGELVGAEIRELKLNYKKRDTLKFSMGSMEESAKLIDLGVTEIAVYLAGQPDPVFHGPIWTCRGRGLGLDEYHAESLESYLDDRYVESDLSYANMDQVDICWNILGHTQAQTDGDLRIGGSFNLSGVTRKRDYLRYERHNIHEIMDAFRGLSNGFDWDIVQYGNGDRWFEAWYPKRGQVKPNAVVEWGRNVSNFEFEENGRMVNDAIAQGKGDGPHRIEGRYTDTARRAETRLRTLVFRAGSKVKEVQTLNEKAQRRVEQRQKPELILKPTIDDHVDLRILDLVPGDEIPIRIKRGRIDVNGTYLVQSIDINPYADTANLEVEI